MDINPTTNTETINLTGQSEQKKVFPNINITECLPNEILLNIFSRLDAPDLYSCKSVCESFSGVADIVEKKYNASLSALKTHPMLSVDYYKSVTRSWLQTINIPNARISYLDNQLSDDNFSLQLFFGITRYLAKKENIVYEKATTLMHNLGRYIQGNACTISCYLSPTANVIVSLSHNNAAKVWRLSANNWSLEDTLNNFYEGKPACINNICFSPDGCFIVTISHFEFKIWSYVDGHWQENSAFENSYSNKLYFRPDSKRFVIMRYDPEIYDLIDDKWQLVTDNVLDVGNLNNIDPDACGSTTPYIKNNTKIDHWLQSKLQIHFIHKFSNYKSQPFGNRIMTLLFSSSWKTWGGISEQFVVHRTCASFDMKLFMISISGGYRGDFTVIFELIDNKWQEKIIIKGETKWACFSLDNKKVILFQEHIIEGFTNYTTQQKLIVYNITKNGIIKTLDLDCASGVVFSADSKYIASSAGSTVQIWQETINNQQSGEQQLINSWQLITTIKNGARVANINFSIDKRLLIIMLENGEINIHQLK